MKIKILLFKIVFSAGILVLFNDAFCQKDLKLIDPNKPHKKIIFKENNLISLKHFKADFTKPGKLSSKEIKKLNKVIGRIENINDSTITLRKLFSRKTVCIQLETVTHIRKEVAVKYVILGVIAGSTIGASLFILDVGIHYALIANLPAVLLMEVVFPFKHIKNPYLISVESFKL